MLPCLFSCFASCMRSGELFYGMRVLRGSCGELAMAALELVSGDGAGRNLRVFSSLNHSMISWHCRCPMRCPSRHRPPAPGWPPSLATTRPLGRFWAGFGQVLGRFWAGLGQVLGSRASSSLLLLPVPCPAVSR